MMNDLFWALYWINVVDNIGWATFAFLMLSFFISAPIIIGLIEDNSAFRRKYPHKTLLFILFVGCVLGTLKPDKSTMYVMLGVKTTENVMASETGKKLQQIVDNELDSLLKKYTKKD